MEVFFRHRGTEVKITEPVLVAAARNERQGNEIMELLFRHRGTEVKITEEVIKEVTRNQLKGERIISLIFNHRGSELKINEETLIEVAAARIGSGFRFINFLHGKVDLEITPAVIEAAATSGNIQILEHFEKWGFMGSNKKQWFNIANLYSSANDKSAAKLRQLIAEGTPPDIPDRRGVTPLAMAVKFDQLEGTEILLATNAVNVNARCIDGRTPLSWAAQAPNPKLAQMLLDYGADPNIADNDGVTPISLARSKPESDYYAEVLAVLMRDESTRQKIEQRIKLQKEKDEDKCQIM